MEFEAKSAVFRDLLRVSDAAAKGSSPVLITGGGGVEKDFFAHRIHSKSPCSGRSFFRIECFSGGKIQFEKAVSGTLFLDGLEFLSGEAQARLLSLLRAKKIGARIISFASGDLEKMVREGKFLSDLFFSLNVVVLRIPPLRERPEDIIPLAEFFLKKISAEGERKVSGFSDGAKKMLLAQSWPGNVRELENAVQRAFILGKGPEIEAADFEFDGGKSGVQTLKDAVNDFKKKYVLEVLAKTSGNQTKAAKILGIQRTYLSRLLAEFDIR